MNEGYWLLGANHAYGNIGVFIPYYGADDHVQLENESVLVPKNTLSSEFSAISVDVAESLVFLINRDRLISNDFDGVIVRGMNVDNLDVNAFDDIVSGLQYISMAYVYDHKDIGLITEVYGVQSDNPKYQVIKLDRYEQHVDDDPYYIKVAIFK